MLLCGCSTLLFIETSSLNSMTVAPNYSLIGWGWFVQNMHCVASIDLKSKSSGMTRVSRLSESPRENTHVCNGFSSSIYSGFFHINISEACGLSWLAQNEMILGSSLSSDSKPARMSVRFALHIILESLFTWLLFALLKPSYL